MKRDKQKTITLMFFVLLIGFMSWVFFNTVYAPQVASDHQPARQKTAMSVER